MSSINTVFQKNTRRLVFFLVTFLPGVMHVQKTLAQTVGNKDFAVLLDNLLKHTVPEVSAKQIVESKNVLFLDARKKMEFDVSHIENAIWVGYLDFDSCKLIGIDKQQPIIVYCSVGFRSEKIAEKLISSGYKNVKNLYGGIFEWVNSGYDIVNTQGKTNEVHTFNKDWSKWVLKGEKVY